MEWHEILGFIQDGEHKSARFFRDIRHEDQLGPALVAMANSKGGTILVGFDLQNCHLVGSSIDQAYVERLLSNYCVPNFACDVRTFTRNDNEILVIGIPELQHKPGYYKNKCYVMENSHPWVLEKESEAPAPPRRVAVTPLASISQQVPEEYQPEDGSPEAVASASPSGEQVTETISIEGDDINTRQKTALQYISANQSIKNKTYRGMFGISHKTAHLELVDLVSKGFIVSQGSGRSTCYVMNPERKSEQAALKICVGVPNLS